MVTSSRRRLLAVTYVSWLFLERHGFKAGSQAGAAGSWAVRQELCTPGIAVEPASPRPPANGNRELGRLPVQSIWAIAFIGNIYHVYTHIIPKEANFTHHLAMTQTLLHVCLVFSITIQSIHVAI